MLKIVAKMFIMVMALVATVFVLSGIMIHLAIQLDSCQEAAQMCVEIAND